jgi:hypothetical protein
MTGNVRVHEITVAVEEHISVYMCECARVRAQPYLPNTQRACALVLSVASGSTIFFDIIS